MLPCWEECALQKLLVLRLPKLAASVCTYVR